MPRIIPPLILVTIGCIAFANAMSGPFIFDDMNSIPHNPHIRSLWPIWEPLTPTPHSAVAARPVIGLSLAVNYAIGGLDVRGYHAVNLAAHLATALLLFGLIRRTLLTDALRPRYQSHSDRIALIVTLWWTVHPIQTEVINYTIQRTEIFMGLFYLLTLYCIARSATSPQASRWRVAAVLACALGMGSKEVTATAPIIALLYDRVYFADSFRDLLRRRWPLYAGLAATWIVVAVCVGTAPRDESVVRIVAGAVALDGTVVTPWTYLLTQTQVILHYLKISIWPHPLVLHYHWPIARSLTEVLLPAGFVLILFLITLWLLWAHPTLGFPGMCFFFILAPSSSILPIVTEVAAERRMYLPLAVVILFFVLLAHAILIRRPPSRFPVTPIGCAAMIGLVLLTTATLTFVTWRRNHDYRSDLAIWADTVDKQPLDPIAHLNLGSALAARGNLPQATRHFAESVSLLPTHAVAQYNLANAFLQQGKPEMASPHLTEALRIDPEYAAAHATMGILFAQRNELEQAEKHFAHALILRPDDAVYNVNMGNLRMAKGQIDQAINNYQRAVKKEPNHFNALNGLAFAYAQARQFDEAVTTAQAALRSAAAANRSDFVRLIQDRIRTYEAQRDQQNQPASTSPPAKSPESP
jgi:Flp pilus assembly protein TadD